MAYVSTHENPSSLLQTMKTAFVGEDSLGGDRVDFTSFSHRRLFRDAHESDQNELSYFVTRHPEDRSMRVLARREDNRVDDEPREGGRVQILVEDIEDFQLEYLDPTTHEFVKSWDTTQGAMQPNRLPSQVRIELTVKDVRDASKEHVYGTRAVLPMVWALNHANYL
jgi:general secretion pathway protein J